MYKIFLVKPTEEYEAQVMNYKKIFEEILTKTFQILFL